MNERDFDNFDDIFNKKLNEVPNFPNEDRNWEKISAKIDALSKNSATHHGLWWWLFIGLLLLGWNGWQTWTIRQMQQDNKQLLGVIQNFDNRLIHQKDTVFETRTVIKVDTIYHYIHVFTKPISGIGFTSKNISASEVNSFYSGSKSIESPSKNNFSVTNDKILTSNTPPSVYSEENQNLILSMTTESTKKDTSTLSTSATIENKAKKQPSEHQTDITDTKPVDTVKIQKQDNIKVKLDSFEKKLTQSDNIPTSSIPIIQKSTIKIIKGINLGVYASLSDLLPQQPNVNVGKWGGISADFSIHTRLSITTDISQLNTHYKIFEYPKKIEPLNLPRQPFSSQDYALKYIEGHIKSWQFGMSGNYTFLPQKKIKPFLTTGYVYRIVLPTEVEFEYLNTTTQDEKSFKAKNNNHIDNWWRVGLGIEGNIYKKIGAKISANYLLDFDKKDNTRLKYWALNTGISYKIR